MSPAQLEQIDSIFYLRGDITFYSVSELARDEVLQQHLEAGDVTVDLHDVSQCDSAGLALLIDWTRFARQHRHRLNLIALPKQLIAIATACGVLNFFDGVTDVK